MEPLSSWSGLKQMSKGRYPKLRFHLKDGTAISFMENDYIELRALEALCGELDIPLIEKR